MSGINGGKVNLNLEFLEILLPGIDITSGSLGHCIGSGAGMAISYKNNNQDKKVYVVISEGELYEGPHGKRYYLLNTGK